LRENSTAFLSKHWTPLIPTCQDSIWVNKWPDLEKTIYTIYSAIPEGFSGALIKVRPSEKIHYVDIWHHEELIPDTLNGSLYLPCEVSAFDQKWQHSRREGNVDCIAEFPIFLNVNLEYDTLTFAANRGDKILLWKGLPSYQNDPLVYSIGSYKYSILELFDRYEGKFVIQLFDKDELLDERVGQIEPGTARLMTIVEQTPSATNAPAGMVKIPSGEITVKLSANDQSATVRYPRKYQEGKIYKINGFHIDQYPVTNQDFKNFLVQTGYRPLEGTNFLAHWIDGEIPSGLENYPVVYVSLQDARSYAKWAGKRLPTELEWQLAAQGLDGRDWPWGAEFDSSKCNVGNGVLQAVNRYPQGANPYGVMDLVGNVWQWTNDVYDNGSYYYGIIRGGSYYDPTSSWWYVKGGPQSLNMHQLIYLVDERFDRNATVGFRCVKDIERTN
jgi:formylglycine-generating enzyme required for sulfatase activity